MQPRQQTTQVRAAQRLWWFLALSLFSGKGGSSCGVEDVFLGGHTGPCCPRHVPRRSGLGGGRRGSRRGRPLLGGSRGGQRSGTLIAAAAAAAGTAVGVAAAAAGAVVVVAVAESRSIRACPTLCAGAVAWAVA